MDILAKIAHDLWTYERLVVGLARRRTERKLRRSPRRPAAPRLRCACPVCGADCAVRVICAVGYPQRHGVCPGSATPLGGEA